MRSKKPVSLSMNEGLRVSMGGCTWARMRNSAATRVAAEGLRAEDQPETLAADAHADVIVLDGDPPEDISRIRRAAGTTCCPPFSHALASVDDEVRGTRRAVGSPFSWCLGFVPAGTGRREERW